ncbi:uncharacterized protein EV420DRAFT_1549441 [Desarmillaria tabescens]|uniref:GST N-terminal domain-containing protein n=1 Tax=Armillaria tabescens TaxID=1929756 RepID=A0AA39N436_ARMTA|nr:uncharacterized protein EV420DRAFT_1549441 [Desarmillaria tabescens]KAK0457217.1 hypothetical protein EV420DRAFT_1549441 [Desarmillaria tabescens]
MSTTITFYDIPSKLPINAYSPNTWKARYALNFKGIPYHTEWVEFPDIEGLYKKFNIQASSTQQDGVTPYYTVPLLHDSSTGAIISESAAIVEYLETTYPDTPRLIPPGTKALHAAFTSAFEPQIMAIVPFSIPAVNAILNPRSEAFFRKTREESFGMTIEDMGPLGELKEKQLALLKHDLGKVDKWMTEGDAFVMGETPTFADVTMCAWMLFLRIILGEDSPEWKGLSTWHGGRWGRLVKSFEKYEVIV